MVGNRANVAEEPSWAEAGVWDGMMDAISEAYDGDLQMIGSSIIRVHQHAGGAKKRMEVVAWAVAEAD